MSKDNLNDDTIASYLLGKSQVITVDDEFDIDGVHHKIQVIVKPQKMEAKFYVDGVCKTIRFAKFKISVKEEKNETL